MNILFSPSCWFSIFENYDTDARFCLFMFLCQICLGIMDVALSQDGFCSAPSILKTDSNSQSLYWKVINPTLSPSHLQGL